MSMADFATARKNMVDGQIHTAGIINQDLLDVFRNVPRETFVPEHLQNIAYNDEDLFLGAGRYIPKPIAHARMVQAVEPKKTDNVLDIGGATGYTAAIIAALVKNVTALEEPQFLEYARQIWDHLRYDNIYPAHGNFYQGYGVNGPYDIIYVNGAVTEIPATLTEQLAPGGRLIAIVKKPGAVMGQVTLVKSTVETRFSSRVLFETGAEYLPGFEPQPTFIFNR